MASASTRAVTARSKVTLSQGSGSHSAHFADSVMQATKSDPDDARWGSWARN
jgi:hypothetical protein